MKRDDTGSASIIYVEADDDKQVIFHELETLHDQKNAFVIVLKGQLTKAFQSPKDFHDFKLLKRQVNLPIIFVIPKSSLSQWAIGNGFTVYPSLEALTQTTPGKANRNAFARAQLIADPPLSSEPSEQRATFLTPDLAVDDPPPRFSAPLPFLLDDDDESPPESSLLTPDFPLHAEMFPEQESPSFAPPQRPLPPPVFAQASPKKSRRGKPTMLIILLALIVLIAALSAGLLFAQRTGSTPSAPSQQAASPSTVVGHLYFLSSGQLSQVGTTGINDKIELELSSMSPPATGKSYFAWLRSDANMSDGSVILLGQLTVSHGSARLVYTDAQHTDLLVQMSRVLITEEDASLIPTVPSLDSSAWHFAGGLSQEPAPNDQKHYSLLDHVRHLLAAEPSLEARGLHGGLNLWLYRNVGKLLEWTRNAQDGWGNPNQSPLMRRQVMRVLEYLDGTGEINTDVAGHPPIIVDAVEGQVGILQTHAYQDPSSLLEQIGFHLTSLVEAPGVSAAQRQTALQLDGALNAVQSDLENARQDAKQLVMLSDSQLQGPRAQSLLNDLVTQTTTAYVGTTDPSTGKTQPGVVGIYESMHMLGTIDITPS